MPRPVRLPRATSLAPLVLLAALGGPSCAAAPRVPVDGARALARVVRQVDAGSRVPGTPGHDVVRDWIAAELERLGAKVERQSFVDMTLGKPTPLTNVIGHFAGTGKATRTIVLCAHYDTRPWCDQDPDSAWHDRPVPGANDAGSGVAVLLEVAEALAKRRAPVQVDLVFFDGEDQGQAMHADEFSLGARGYAARVADHKPAAAFLFDMVGDRDLGIHPERNSIEHAANLVELVQSAAQATGARSFHRAPRHDLTDDHTPLNDAGIPAVDIIDFDYPAWHTHRDLPDQVSAESLAEVARVAAWLVYESPLARAR